MSQVLLKWIPVHVWSLDIYNKNPNVSDTQTFAVIMLNLNILALS